MHSGPTHSGPAAEHWEIGINEDDHLAAKLRTLNLQPEQIRHAAISHLHYDHSGGIGVLKPDLRPWPRGYR